MTGELGTTAALLSGDNQRSAFAARNKLLVTRAQMSGTVYYAIAWWLSTAHLV
jgi:hypothetical protein